jgi:hypothetical protein
MKKMILIPLLLLLIVSTTIAQYANKQINPFHKKYHDSLMAMNYPYKLPLLAKKVYKKGYDVPFAWGISPSYFSVRQEISITRTAIGFNDSEPIDLTQYIQFGKIISTGHIFTIRPDIWILPFLNIYGIIGGGTGTIEVPLVEPVTYSTTQPTNGKSMGAGFTLAGGIGGIILILDNNLNFATTDKIDDPIPAYNFDARIGHNFPSTKRADRTLTIWAGVFFQKIKADTKGSIAIKDLFKDPSSAQQEKIKHRLDDWLNDLPPVQHAVAEKIVQKIHDYFDHIDPGDSRITYELDKAIAGPWNMIFGSQYQFNKNCMVRTELGVFGKRSQFLLSLTYRFQSFKKKSAK